MRKIAVLAALVTALVLMGGAALAGPTPRQPAEQRMSAKSAHSLAVAGQHEFFTTLFPGPRRSVVGRCTAGPYVWRCPVTTTTPDARCTMQVWVWADRGGNAYIEWHQLRCTARN